MEYFAAIAGVTSVPKLKISISIRQAKNKKKEQKNKNQIHSGQHPGAEHNPAGALMEQLGVDQVFIGHPTARSEPHSVNVTVSNEIEINAGGIPCVYFL